MFTGLIEELGTVVSAARAVRDGQLQISAPTIASSVRVGDSIAVNGCCLTVATRAENELSFDLLEETLARTNLGALHDGSQVNLEQALAANARLGGHFVQGHIDCTARVLSFEQRGDDHRLDVGLPPEFAQYVVCKGSLAINGISLTVADVTADRFAVWIIPHTKRHTNLATARAGDLVNLEFDILAKYVEGLVDRTGLRK